MEQFELIAPCHFGLEAVLKREILDLGYEIQKVEVMDYEFLKSLIDTDAVEAFRAKALWI